ncbi:MAG: hypothetical protein PF437_09600, partial [Sulfurimonas sp.]|nr:hypothetical protein [Sulfurimonas sp.]
MNRYISSFIISALSYIVIIVAIIYFANTDTRCNADAKIQNVKKVCFSVINQPVAQKPKKEEKIVSMPKPKPKP